MKTNKQTTSTVKHTGFFGHWPIWLAALACGAAGQLWAATATIYSNDFEAYSSVATSEADTADADPNGAEWAMVDDTAVSPTTAGAGIQVINWLSHSSSKSLLFRNGTYTDISLFGARSGSSYQLDFWLYVHKAPGNRGFRITLRGEGADHNGDDYIAYGSVQTTAATIRYYDGVANANTGFWVTTAATHTEDTWQHHRMVINPATQQMTVYIDNMDTPVIENADFARCEIAVPTILRIQHEGDSADDGYCAIDDISFTVENSRDLVTTFTDGFETYPARASADDDADPQGPWITVETDGTGTGRALVPAKVQIVDSTVVTPHSGTNCLKVESGQRAGSSIAWGVPPQSDVQITWWARVPASVAGQQALYLRMSLYGAEDLSSFKGDAALLAYGSRDATVGDATSLLLYPPGTVWVDSLLDYTPDTWEEYRLITHTAINAYTLIKSPSSANPTVIVDRGAFGGNTSPFPTNTSPLFMAAWSSSNGSGHPAAYIDDIEIKSLVSNVEPLGEPYVVTNYGTRFTNWTIINANAPVGRPIVDPRDNTTILCTVDAAPGGIYRAVKVAPGNWSIETTPIVSGLDRPSGLAMETNGTLWWTHDYNNDSTRSVARLKWPWASSSVETIILDVGPDLIGTDDDAIDVTIAPSAFSGVIGQPGMIVVADRGVDIDSDNAVYVIDPATTLLNQTNYNNFLVNPAADSLGADLTAITAVGSNAVATVSVDGWLTVINADGGLTYLHPSNLWPPGGPASGAAIAEDPLTGRIWAADDLKDEIWSIDSSTGADQREIGFPLIDPLRTDRQIDFHDPGMAFAPDGSFLVVSDTSSSSGGRVIIFHNEIFTIPPFSITSVTPATQGYQLSWGSAGAVKYNVQRSVDVTSAASFQNIATNLSVRQFTDTNAPAAGAYYRVQATPVIIP
jgi:hypothetical protein